ncbi:MAG: hypothetical protein Q4C01_01640 [Clostridia bacterium]|nr:hypothetical protein [Clostridia bacterium]
MSRYAVPVLVLQRHTNCEYVSEPNESVYKPKAITIDETSIYTSSPTSEEDHENSLMGSGVGVGLGVGSGVSVGASVTTTLGLSPLPPQPKDRAIANTNIIIKNLFIVKTFPFFERP